MHNFSMHHKTLVHRKKNVSKHYKCWCKTLRLTHVTLLLITSDTGRPISNASSTYPRERIKKKHAPQHDNTFALQTRKIPTCVDRRMCWWWHKNFRHQTKSRLFTKQGGRLTTKHIAMTCSDTPCSNWRGLILRTKRQIGSSFPVISLAGAT